MRLDNYKSVGLLLFLSFTLFLLGCDFSKDEDDEETIEYKVSNEQISFWDTNWEAYKLGGTLTLNRAANESAISGYQLYWGDESKNIMNVDVIIPDESVDDGFRIEQEEGLICSWDKNAVSSSDASVDLNESSKLTLSFSRGDVISDLSGSQNCENLFPEIPSQTDHTTDTISYTPKDEDGNEMDLISVTAEYRKKATHFLLYTINGSKRKFFRSFPIKDNIGEELATMSDDLAYDVAVDSAGNIYLAGATKGDIVNEAIKYDGLFYLYQTQDLNLPYENNSYSDAFLKKYDAEDENYTYHDRDVTYAYVKKIEDNELPEEMKIQAKESLKSVTEVLLRTDAEITKEENEMTADGSENKPVFGAWTRQWGSVGSDSALAVTVGPKGYIYVVGYTAGDQETNPYDLDYFIAKYNSAGDRIWKKHEGTENDDIGNDVVLDRYGNIYVTGVTGGSLAGANQGLGDIFIFKYNSDGEKIWQRQIGTAKSEAGHALAVDQYDNVTLVGETVVEEEEDNNDYNDGSDNAQSTGGEMKGRDAFIIKTDRYGSVLWRRNIKTDKLDRAYDVALDSHGNAYVAGESYENLSQLAYYLEQNMDKEEVYGPYLLKYDPYGNLIWVKHPGTEVLEDAQSRGHAKAVVVDSMDNIYVTGSVYNTLMEYVGSSIRGSNDAFLLRYDIWGNETWHKHIGSDEMDEGFGLAVDSANNIYLAGATNGYLPYGNTTGRELQQVYNQQARKDAFVIRPNTRLSRPYVDVTRGDFIKYTQSHPDIVPTATTSMSGTLPVPVGSYIDTASSAGQTTSYRFNCDTLAWTTMVLGALSAGTASIGGLSAPYLGLTMSTYRFNTFDNKVAWNPAKQKYGYTYILTEYIDGKKVETTHFAKNSSQLTPAYNKEALDGSYMWQDHSSLSGLDVFDAPLLFIFGAYPKLILDVIYGVNFGLFYGYCVDPSTNLWDGTWGGHLKDEHDIGGSSGDNRINPNTPYTFDNRPASDAICRTTPGTEDCTKYLK